MHEADAFKAVLADGNSERRRKLYSQVSRRALPSLGNLILNLAHNRDLLYPGCSAKAKTILRIVHAKSLRCCNAKLNELVRGRPVTSFLIFLPPPAIAAFRWILL